jgi:4-azaleucine resistance transporter AzlC
VGGAVDPGPRPGTGKGGATDTPPSLAAARRTLVVDGLGISLSVAAFGIVFGLAARSAGMSLVEAVAMSTIVFAGASQFAAAGLIAQGAPWPAIVLLTALLNARHVLYSAALMPWLRDRPRMERAAMAHVLTDEAFALTIHHFGRLRRADAPGYWIAAAMVFVPWNIATIVGVLGGQAIPEPTRLGIDVVFPAAMAGLAVLLIRERPDLAAAVVGALVAVAVALAVDPAVGVVAGGLCGPLAGLAMPARGRGEVGHDSDLDRTSRVFGFRGWVVDRARRRTK